MAPASVAFFYVGIVDVIIAHSTWRARVSPETQIQFTSNSQYLRLHRHVVFIRHNIPKRPKLDKVYKLDSPPSSLVTSFSSGNNDDWYQ